MKRRSMLRCKGRIGHGNVPLCYSKDFSSYRCKKINAKNLHSQP
jgi:hypothetical protein